MSATIETVDIAEGFVWTYYYGYLALVMPGIQDRCRDYIQKYPNIFNKFVILMPSSGYCGTSIGESDGNITFAEKIPFEMTRSANIKRSYANFLHKLVDPETSDVGCLLSIFQHLTILTRILKL